VSRVGDEAAGPPRLSAVRYRDLRVGRRWGPFREALAAEDSTALPGGGVLPLLTLRVLRRALDGIPPGGVLAEQRFAVLGPLPPAGDVDVEVEVVAQAERSSGLATTFAFALVHEGAPCARAEWTILAPPEDEGR